VTPEIDVNSIQPAKETFLAADQHEHRLDLLGTARLLDGTEVLICLLPEHKSWVDLRIATQLLTYVLRVHRDECGPNHCHCETKYRPEQITGNLFPTIGAGV